MSDLTDLISAGDARDAAFSALPADTPFDFGSFVSTSGTQGNSFDFGSGAPLIAPVLGLPTTGGGMTELFRSLAGLVQIGYQGEALVQQQKLQNKIANARLSNQLQTIRSTPNVWLALGAAGVAAFLIFDRRDSRRYK